jgi:hypothetical protein
MCVQEVCQYEYEGLNECTPVHPGWSARSCRSRHASTCSSTSSTST